MVTSVGLSFASLLLSRAAICSGGNSVAVRNPAKQHQIYTLLSRHLPHSPLGLTLSLSTMICSGRTSGAVEKRVSTYITIYVSTD